MCHQFNQAINYNLKKLYSSAILILKAGDTVKKTHIDMLDTLYLTKAIVFLGMIITVLSLTLAIASIFPEKVPLDPIDDDVSRPFELWVYSYIAAFISLFFYLIDGIFCIIRAFYKLDTVFNLILGFLIFGSIPMIIFVGSWYPGSIIWNIYYFALFVLEIVSMWQKVKHIKQSSE